jgi:hypothetical protein
MPAIDNALREVKQANATAGGVAADGARRAKLAAVKRTKSAAGCSTASTG